MSLTPLFLLIALILFVIEGVRTKSLIAAGLAFATASQIVGTVIG